MDDQQKARVDALLSGAARPGDPLDIRVVFNGTQADAIRALAESYGVGIPEMVHRLVITGAKTTLGELQFKVDAAKKGR